MEYNNEYNLDLYPKKLHWKEGGSDGDQDHDVVRSGLSRRLPGHLLYR